MSNKSAYIETYHIDALVNYLRDLGYIVSRKEFERDSYLINHAERLEPGDVTLQKQLLQGMIDVRDNYRMWA